MKHVIIILCFLPVFFACEKLEEKLPDSSLLKKQVEQSIAAAVGGVLGTSDTVELVIPPNALSEDGFVFLGRTGSEPGTVPNENLQLVGIPITIRIPSDTILKPFSMSFPLPSYPTISDKVHFFLYNGTSYYPIEHKWENQLIKVTIDLISWENNDLKTSAILSELIIIGLILKQSPPAEEMGLKEVEVINGYLTFNQPDADPSSRILLMVHGWTGRPAKWEVFIPKIQMENKVPYTDYWTFGYNSSYGIEVNASNLSDLIHVNANGAQIDIVAHSMGGLVSRSMIENQGGQIYVNKLITLGTPHQGSPLAAIRNMLGSVISMEGDHEVNMIYDYYSQGFKDLYTGSAYIANMMKLETPPIPYYLIACTNEPSALNYISRSVLTGPDDGVVEVTSAKGVQGAIVPEYDVQIALDIAHLEMTRDDAIYEQIKNILLE